jgi:hypothetical protein
MSTLSPSAAQAVGARAALVLLVTLLAHALLIDRVGTMLAEAADEPPAPSAAVTARLLPPAELPAIPTPAAAPVPRPARAVARAAARPPAPAGAPAAPAPGEWPATVDVGADAFGAAPPPNAPASPAGAEPGGAATAPPAEASPAPQVAAGQAAVPESAPFEATGEALLAALAGLPEPRAVLPAAARYVYRTTNSELRLASGLSTVDWSVAADGEYRLRLSTTAVGLTVLELESRGRLRPFGLAPDRYTETRIRRGAVAANFDWEGRRVTFSARPHERPLPDGVQDRVSFQFQLMLLGQAQPELFRAGREAVLLMAGRDDVSTYRFRSAGEMPAMTGLGELMTVKIERIGQEKSDARVEVWLAPSLGWLPARLRFTDRYGRVTESVLESMPT